jgi:PAS domain S-box-containing protein
MSPPTPRRPGGSIVAKLYWTAPYIAVVAFALTMLVIVWTLQMRETEIERTALARDVQWAERTMRTHFIANEDFLTQVARDIANGSLDGDGFQLRATPYLADNPELLDIVWMDASGKVRWAVPSDGSEWLPGDELSPSQGQIARHARELGRAAYGQPYRASRGSALMEVFVPVQRGRSPYGLVIAVYSVEGLLQHLVPSWFSDKYRLTMIDSSGETLVVNASSHGTDDALSSLIVFDPPGNGLALRATAFRNEGELPPALPMGLIVGLSVMVLWSLWALRSHMDKRVRVERERDQLFIVSLDMLCSLDPNGSYRRVNPAFERVLGLPMASFEGRPLLARVHPDERASAAAALARLARGEPFTFEARMRCADGHYKWLVWSAKPVEEDRVTYAVAHDITDRKAAEDAWRAESTFRKAMEESVLTGLLATDMKGRIVYVNPAFCAMLGHAENELIGAKWPADRRGADGRLVEFAPLRRALAEVSPSEGQETRIPRQDGRLIDVRLMVSPLVDSAGQQTGWMAAVSDITESKRIRAELEAAHERFVAVLDGLDTAVYVADARSDEILYANRAFMLSFGFNAIGRSTYNLSLPLPERSAYPVDPRLLRPEGLPRELFDGQLFHAPSERWYHVRERAARWVDGRIVRMSAATDITDRKRVEELNHQQEERLQRTSRLITMGEMASTLAHELNQPLSAIANYSSGCVNRLQSGRYKPEELLAAMQKTAFQADRAGKILRRIRDFVRKSEPQRSAVSLSSVADDALGFAEIDARKHGARVENLIGSDTPLVWADRIMIEQVVLNLVKNGIEAMSDIPAEYRLLRLTARAKGDQVEVAVADRGRGISPDDREKLFDAFFTTKSDGMGMGLNICRSIIEYHNGRLWVENAPEGGTIFRFTLPMEHLREPDAEPA